MKNEKNAMQAKLEKLKALYKRDSNKLARMILGDWSKVLSESLVDDILMKIILIREHYKDTEHAKVTPILGGTFKFLKKVDPENCKKIIYCKKEDLLRFEKEEFWEKNAVIVFPHELSRSNYPPRNHKNLWRDIRKRVIQEISNYVSADWVVIGEDEISSFINFTREVTVKFIITNELVKNIKDEIRR